MNDKLEALRQRYGVKGIHVVPYRTMHFGSSFEELYRVNLYEVDGIWLAWDKRQDYLLVWEGSLPTKERDDANL